MSISDASAEIEKLEEKVRNLESKNQHLEFTLEQITTSKSWILTQYLRNIAEKMRKFFPIIRFKKSKFDLKAGNNIRAQKNKFYVTGQSSYLNLTRKQGSKAHSGWVKINCDFKSARGQMFFLLHWRTQSGFTPSERAWLSLTNGKQDGLILNLPKRRS